MRKNMFLKQILLLIFLVISSLTLSNDGVKIIPKSNTQIINRSDIISGKKEALKKTEVIFNYADNSVYEVFAKPDFLTTIKLAPGESVIEVAGGNTDYWKVDWFQGGKDQRTYIYIRPEEEDLKTNIVILTNKHTYYLNIESTSNEYNSIIEWKYPQERKILLENFEKNNDVLATEPEKINMNYSVSNKLLNFSPEGVYDDGERTYIKFKNNLREMPTVLVKGVDGQSTLTNPEIKDKRMIIDRVTQKITLIIGKRKLYITNLNKLN